MKTKINKILTQVEKPGRYTGGEYGLTQLKRNPAVRIALCFPDLYEVGMSNLAVKMLYSLCNSLQDVQCERVFAPGEDFEKQLRENAIPLYTLETETPLREFDIVAFSIGYELSATNVLNILDLGGIPVLKRERSDNDPVVIAGGPAITNPLPFSDFLDSVLIGEGETELLQLLSDFTEKKKKLNKFSRKELLEIFNEKIHWWSEKSPYVQEAAVWDGFSDTGKYFDFTPVQSIKTVQDHGVIEIMRGCRNGCRFCHAGYFYRPCREKSIETIIQEADSLIYDLGYREITLSSLSSGDYSNIIDILRILNKRYADDGVSFSLPSLKVDSFTLDLLEHVSIVRKSGLTFAVETPLDIWQSQINKTVSLEKCIDIIKKAKELGWKQAKFYFMIGLPLAEQDIEEDDAIINFVYTVLKETGINLHVNIGTFVPKPHTPFQWAAQLDFETAFLKISRIKKAFRSKKIKFTYHSPFLSFIEGIISRGDKRVGNLILKAFHEGARFDAWEDKFQRDIWETLIAELEWDAEKEITEMKRLDEPLPWADINIGVSRKFLKREWERSISSEITKNCSEICTDNCGVCRKQYGITYSKGEGTQVREKLSQSNISNGSEILQSAVLFSFEKRDGAVFLSHLNLMTAFERSLQRAGIKTAYTKGFNPKPRLEFAQPLPLGITAEDDIVSFVLPNQTEQIKKFFVKEFIMKMNEMMPQGLSVLRAQIYPERFLHKSEKGSLMSSFWGAEYSISSENADKIVDFLNQYLKEYSLKTNITLLQSNKNILITIKNNMTKATNIKNILAGMTKENTFESFLSSASVSRTRVWAKDEEGRRLDYFKVYSPNY